MPPPASVLFHNKRPKPNSVKKESSDGAIRPRKPAVARTSPKKEPEDDVKPLVKTEGSYQEFKLVSCKANGWNYDVMKFDSRKPIDISSWNGPVKLNRKELKREVGPEVGPVAVGPMLGPDGKPVIRADGSIVMVDADGKPIPQTTIDATGKEKEKDLKDKKKKFQKKTKQVFLVPEEVRKLRREERYPWVFEDGPKSEVWVGMMEEAAKSDTHALFMPAPDNVFKFVPAYRWYKFQKKPTTYSVPSLEEAEKLMAQMQKNKDPERWLLHRRNGQGPSSATAAIFKAESEGRTVSGGSSLVHTSGQSLGPGGRRLKTVDAGMRGLFEEDDEEGVDVKRKREREFGGEGDIDEMEYEDDFADDEEQLEPDKDQDDEAKELEERLKRAYKTANKTREGYIDESEEEEEGEEHLTGAGKAMKKLVKKIDKNAGYDSDEDKNPYASSDDQEEEEEEHIPTVTEVAAAEAQARAQEQAKAEAQVSDSVSRSNSQPPTSKSDQKKNLAAPRLSSSKNPSRAGTPAPAPAASTSGPSGHSLVAKRATSPRPPKKGSAAGSRASSPLVASRATSPVAPTISPGHSRAVSPTAPGSANPGKLAVPTVNVSNKRKATDDNASVPSPTGINAPKLKKRKPQPGAVAPGGELTDEMVIEWLRNTPNATTRDCIQYFQPCLTDDAKKAKFTTLVKEVAILKQGVLVLRSKYADPAGAPAASPPATS